MLGSDEIWRVGQNVDVHGTGGQLYKAEYFDTIEESIKCLDNELQALSLDISGSISRKYTSHHPWSSRLT